LDKGEQFLKTSETPAHIQYEVMNPRGICPPIKMLPLVDRIPDLNGKVLYIVNTRKPHAEETLLAVAGLMKERFPGADIQYIMKKTSYRDDEPELWKEVAEKADAAIVGPGD
jgi:hypothetical protein